MSFSDFIKANVKMAVKFGDFALSYLTVNLRQINKIIDNDFSKIEIFQI
jgi:hypothetical protein